MGASAEGDEADVDALMRLASAARARGEWRETRRHARAALALVPQLEAAELLVAEADQALSAETLAAIQAAAEVTQQQLEERRQRRRFPLAGLFGGLPLPRLALPRVALPSGPSLPRPGFGWPRIPGGGLSRASVGGTPILPIAGAATLFVLAGLAAFIALGQLSNDDGGEPPALAANATSVPEPGAGGGADDPTPTPSVAGDSLEAPTIEAVGCRQLEDGVTLECRPTIDGAADSYLWAAAGGEPADGDGEVFRTVMPAGGPYRIALEVCSGAACSSSESQAFVVSVEAAATPEPSVSTDPGGASSDPAPTATPLAGPPPPAAPSISGVSCSPSPAEAGETVVCSGSFGGGAVSTFDWSVNGLLIASSATLSGAYDGAGQRTIGLQVCNAGGCDSDTFTLIVQAPPELNPPVINSIGCTPTAIQVGDGVTCEPTVSGEVDAYAWSSGASRGSQPTFSISFAIVGTRTIELEVCNADGCDTGGAEIEITALPPPPAPELDVSTFTLNFGTTATTLPLQIANTGGPTLDWFVIESLTWLSASPTNGNQSGTVNVTVDRSTLPSGPSAGVFNVNSNGGNVAISVSLVKPDVVDPVVTAPASTSIEVAFGESGVPIGDPAVVAWLAGASAVDDLDGVLSVGTNAPAIFPIGGTPVTFSATDAAGNSGQDSATLTITIEDDVTPPVVTAPGDTEVSVAFGTTSVPDSNPDVAAWLALASVFDERGEVLTIGHGPTSFAPGATAVTFSATDAASNTGDATATLTVTVLPETFTLTLLDDGNGSASSPQEGTQLSGTPVTLSASPDSGFLFDAWSGGLSCPVDGSTNPAAGFTLLANATCTANFVVVP